MTLPIENYWEKPSKGYVRVPQAVLQDSNLSLSAKGLYLLLASQAQIPNPDWVICKQALINLLAPHSKYNTAKDELCAVGYLHCYQISGQNWRTAYVLLDTPTPPGSADTRRFCRDLPALQSHVQEMFGISLGDGPQMYNHVAAPVSNYIKIPRKMIEDQGLYLSDKGMYAVLASRIFAPGWTADLEHDIKRLSSPKEGYRPPMQRLERRGYLYPIKISSEGRFSYCYLLFAGSTAPTAPLKALYRSFKEAQADVEQAFGIKLSTSPRSQRPCRHQPRGDQPREDQTRGDRAQKKNNIPKIDYNNIQKQGNTLQSVADCIRAWAEYREDKYVNPKTNEIYQLVVNTLIRIVADDQNRKRLQKLKDQLNFDHENMCNLSEHVEELAETIACQASNGKVIKIEAYIHKAVLNHFGWDNEM